MTFIPHGYCLAWDPGLVFIYIMSNATIGIAYYMMPVALIYLAANRADLPFRTIFICTGVFVLACGTGHFMGVIDLYYPVYWASGVIKLVTAVASIGTTIAIWHAIPTALELPTHAQLEAARERLAEEQEERRRAEERLRDVIQLRNYQPPFELTPPNRTSAPAIAFADRLALLTASPLLDATASANRLDRAPDC